MYYNTGPHPGLVSYDTAYLGDQAKRRGAMLTHNGWLAALQAEGEALDLTCDDIYLGIYPMAHVGISWGLSVLRAAGPM